MLHLLLLLLGLSLVLILGLALALQHRLVVVLMVLMVVVMSVVLVRRLLLLRLRLRLLMRRLSVVLTALLPLAVLAAARPARPVPALLVATVTALAAGQRRQGGQTLGRDRLFQNGRRGLQRAAAARLGAQLAHLSNSHKEDFILQLELNLHHMSVII